MVFYKILMDINIPIFDSENHSYWGFKKEKNSF